MSMRRGWGHLATFALSASLAWLAGHASAAPYQPYPGYVAPKAAPPTPIVAPLNGQVLIRADEVDYDMDNQIVSARGHVEVDHNGRILMADRVDYDQKNDTVTASGNVSLLDEKGNVTFAQHVVLTDQMKNGVLQGFAALIGKNGRMTAADAERIQARFVVARHAAYTPCKICAKTDRTPLWAVRAERVVWDQTAHRIVFRNATVSFLGVPVIYTPYYSTSDPTVKHSSGLLAPIFGNSTVLGYFVRLPVYLSFSDSEDMTLAPQFATLGGEQLQVEYRKRWEDGGMWLQASAATDPHAGLNDEQTQNYAHIFGSGRTPIDDVWRTGFDVQYSSNNTYLQRYDISLLDRLLSDVFIDGEMGYSRLNVTGYYFEGLRATDSADQFPFVLPLLQYTFIPQERFAGGLFRFDVNTAVVTRDLGADSQRMTAELDWTLPFIAADGQLLTLTADARGDIYHTSNNDLATTPNVPLNSRFVSRGVPYVMLEWRWPFIKPMDQGRSIVVEPIAQLIAMPYGMNPKGIPNEDSAAFELDENNIFSENQLPGYDLVESGPRANVGFRAEALFPSGSVETVWGETFRVKPDPIFGIDSGEFGTASDVVGRVSVKFYPYIDLTDRIDIDRASGSVVRHEVYLTGIWGRSTVTISYVQLPQEVVTLGLGPREEINAQADVNLFGNWLAFGGLRRDLIAGQMLDTELGVGYEDECFGIALGYHRRFTSTLDLPPATSLILRFQLKTGEQPIEPFDLIRRDMFAHP